MALALRPSARRSLALFTGLAIVMLSAVVPVSAAPPAGTLTARNSMLNVLAAGGTATPIITVGESIGGYRFESLPDGISIYKTKDGQTDVYLNHETSTVPFPVAATGSAWLPTNSGNGTMNDFDNSQLSKLVLNNKTGGVISAAMVLPSSAGYQRFCSQFLGDKKAGFERPIVFLNEEATDFVNRSSGINFTISTTEGSPAGTQQAGVVVGYDVLTGTYKTILGMGRFNHENNVAVPGYGMPILVSGDDTFSSNPPNSQVYMYKANSAFDVWNDNGTLYTFKASLSTFFNDYYDFVPGTNQTISGEFVPINSAAAKGTQAALESASDAAGAFEFVRIEDMAYDKTNPNILYISDTGRASNSLPGAGYNANASKNGRIWKMVLNKHDPLKVDSLSILYEGDTTNLGVVGVIHQPDNLETTPGYLYVTEDPSSANQVVSPARIWRIDLKGANAGTATVVANVDQAYDGDGSMDVDGFANANLGSWEASGIIDVSQYFGAGAFLVTVQAHSVWVEKEVTAANLPDDYTRSGSTWSAGPDGFPDWMYKREGGQLVLIKIPGG